MKHRPNLWSRPRRLSLRRNAGTKRRHLTTWSQDSNFLPK